MKPFTKEQLEFIAKSHTILFCGVLEGIMQSPEDVYKRMITDISDENYEKRVIEGFEKLINL